MTGCCSQLFLLSSAVAVTRHTDSGQPLLGFADIGTRPTRLVLDPPFQRTTSTSRPPASLSKSRQHRSQPRTILAACLHAEESPGAMSLSSGLVSLSFLAGRFEVPRPKSPVEWLRCRFLLAVENTATNLLYRELVYQRSVRTNADSLICPVPSALPPTSSPSLVITVRTRFRPSPTCPTISHLRKLASNP